MAKRIAITRQRKAPCSNFTLKEESFLGGEGAGTGVGSGSGSGSSHSIFCSVTALNRGLHS